MRNTSWVMERIARARPESGGDPSTDVQRLVDALLALKRGKTLHVFGIVPAAIEATGKPQVIDACEEALREWSRAFTASGNRFGLWELSRASVKVAMPELRLEKPFPLQCDPLGDTTSLDPAWKDRIERARIAAAGKMTPRLEGLGFEAKHRAIKLGPPDRDGLYAQALRFETYMKKPFPREIAAWWSVIDGISIDAVGYLYPAKGWILHGTIDGALILGTGRFARGTLALLPVPAGSTERPIIDFDEGGRTFRKYPSFAALADQIFGAP